ncbi:surface lipoprotein assembly modifier [Govanella unica]|uniref:Surface lipoprotein assembly modifier n=1 Tax=Govanella unica TaxID=2975056 RepID=A0A9X3Z7A6_9PROT|nr:surface lipoprotein assembly modifier [Govania unica]MDA5193966.1 surface lipoprotein assembly modifier [Govania unica]
MYAVFLVTALTGCIPAAAMETPSSAASQGARLDFAPTSSLDKIRQLILAGHHKEARELLSRLRQGDVDQIQIAFLEAEMHGRENNWRKAARIYRLILADHPEILRVRLELARSFFELKDYVNARKQFEIVLANRDLPPTVARNIERYIDAIRHNKAWTFNFSVGLAQDTNINSATSDHEALLLGLPFELLEDARKSPGLGLTADISGSYRFPSPVGSSFELSGGLQHTEYNKGSTFDYTMTQAGAGPRFILAPNTELLVSAVGSYNRYGGRAFYKSYGARLNLRHKMTDRLYLSSILDTQVVDFQRDNARDGWLVSATIQASYLLSQISLLQGFVGLVEEMTEVDSLSSLRYRGGLSYRRELPFGFTSELSGELSYRKFKDIDWLHGARREDWALRLGTTISNRKLDIGGFIPVIEYNYYEGMSNINFYDYDRHRVTINFTRIF